MKTFLALVARVEELEKKPEEAPKRGRPPKQEE
jgi:hypothetical protein